MVFFFGGWIFQEDPESQDGKRGDGLDPKPRLIFYQKIKIFVSESNLAIF